MAAADDRRSRRAPASGPDLATPVGARRRAAGRTDPSYAGSRSRQRPDERRRAAAAEGAPAARALSRAAARATGWGRLVRLLERPVAFLLIAVLISAGTGYGVTKLRPDASAQLLADTGSPVFKDQVRFANLFGADPVVVMVEPAKGQSLLTPDHMVGLAQLEGSLAKMHGVKKVYGPGTLVNTFAGEVTKRALDLCGAQGKQAQQAAVDQARKEGRAAAQQTSAGQAAFDSAVKTCAQQLAARYPTLSVPALNNPNFFNELLLEPNGAVRPFWKSVLPDTRHALISVRMDRSASISDVEAVTERVGRATSGSQSQQLQTSGGQKVNVPTQAGNLKGLRFTVSGTPALAAELARAVQRSLEYLLPIALLAMLLITALVLRVRYRLLAVPLAALAAVWTAGAGALAGLPLTPATLAVLPVVLGLTTDYLLQAANRLAEQEGDPSERLRGTVAAILPATATAALATAAGVLAFALCTVPLVRQFAFFLAIGVAASYLAALLVGLPLLALFAHVLPPAKVKEPPSWQRLVRLGRLPRAALVPLILAGLAGWVALPFQRIETDPARLMPPSSQGLAGAEHIRQAVGIVGELDLVVSGQDVTTPAVVAWMGVSERKLQGQDLKPEAGLPDFLLAFNYGKAPDEKTTRTILDRLPPYLTQSVVSQDRHVGVVSFGQTQVTSVDQDRQTVDRVNSATADPPAGYHAYPAGLSVLAASALDRLTHDQVWLNLLALGLVLAVLLAAYRALLPALLAVMPTAVAAGWVTGLMYASGARATPITVLLSGVVVAFATEFGVLWLSRFRAELKAGLSADESADVASRRVGPAIVAAAAALVAGFAVLAVSPVPMVRDFGLWSAGDLALATVAVLFLLPPAARALLGERRAERAREARARAEATR